MNLKENAGSFEAVVPADEHGSSCLPVVAQAAVPAESCDLRRREAEAWAALVKAESEVPINQAKADALYREWGERYREYEATKTHVGGNENEMSDGGRDRALLGVGVWKSSQM